MILYILFFSFLFSFHGTTGHLSIHGRREKLTSTDNENRSGGLGIRKDTAIGSANDSCPESLQEIHAHGTLLMREMKAEEGGEKEEKKCRVWSNYRRPPPHGSVATDIRPVRQRILCVCPVNQTDLTWPSLLIVDSC